MEFSVSGFWYVEIYYKFLLIDYIDILIFVNLLLKIIILK